jgi:hypothetical protein
MQPTAEKSLRLFSDDKFIQFGGTVFIITPVSQNGCQPFFDHLLGDVAVYQQGRVQSLT